MTGYSECGEIKAVVEFGGLEGSERGPTKVGTPTSFGRPRSLEASVSQLKSMLWQYVEWRMADWAEWSNASEGAVTDEFAVD